MLLSPSSSDRIDRKDLPRDVAQCHELIHSLLGDLDDYKGRVDYLSRRLFGRSSERCDSGEGQLELFEEEQAQADANEEPETEAPALEVKAHTRRGRKPLPKDLPRVRVEHDLPEEEKSCAECGEAKRRIGEETSEQLDYQPASLHVVEHVRFKYACPCCQGEVAIADKPMQPIEKGLAAPGLLAHVLTNKYCDHLPLHRQESILARHGVDISRSTLCDWVMQSAETLKPLVKLALAELLKSFAIHTDATTVRVQDKGTTHQAYFWAYLGDDEHPFTYYDFTWTHSRAGPKEVLSGFKGYLQADAHKVYDELYQPGGMWEVGCWAHARRKFHDAKTTDPVRANFALNLIRKLYDIERDARDVTADERFEMRALRSAPILGDIFEWLGETVERVLPKSPISKATQYALNNWNALIRYLEDGRLAIDNNPAERALRVAAVGRKNWLFAGNRRGGEAAAIAYTLIASAKRAGHDPFAYLRDVLARIPSHPQRELAALLPNNWRAA